MASEFSERARSTKPARGKKLNYLPVTLVALQVACSGGPVADRSRASLSNSVNPEKELTILDLSVIDDPVRTLDPCVVGAEPLPPWSFGKIMEIVANQAGAEDASVFVKDWLDTWKRELVVNGHILAPVAIDQFVTTPWLAESGGERLDLGRSRFRLLSIVNRIDLSREDGKGEFRMEYVATKEFCVPIRFWVIFEFELPVKTIEEVQALARRWHALGDLPFGEDYNAALQAITGELTLAHLKHVNTIETEASVSEWNYRSFALAGGSLVNVALVQSPDAFDDGNPALISWVNANQKAILADEHVVPEELLGGDTRNINWTGAGFEDPFEVRHHFGLATCSGCHNGETGTDAIHTSWRHRGTAPVLSPYLTGETFVDPGGQVRTFNELQRRANVLIDLLQ
jgi:hypothetical protein